MTRSFPLQIKRRGVEMRLILPGKQLQSRGRILHYFEPWPAAINSVVK
jgi:hypothetical protein